MSSPRYVFIILCFPVFLFAQDTSVTISPAVGRIIDAREAAQYGILKAFPGLVEASFTRESGGAFQAHLVLRSGAEVRDSTFTISAHWLRLLHARVEHHAELEAGSYRPGDDDFLADSLSLPFATRREPVKPGPRPGPYVFEEGPTLVTDYPRFGIHVGLTALSTEIREMEGAVRTIERNLGEQGFIVFAHQVEPDVDPMLFIYGLDVAITPEFAGAIEVGVVHQSTADLDSKSSFVALSVVYTPSFLNFGLLRFGAGASYYHWGHSTTFTLSYNTATQPDSTGGHLVFNGITFDAGGSRTGPSALVTADLLIHGTPLLTAYARYTPARSITVAAPYGTAWPHDVSFSLQSISGGVRLTLFF
jgi:hypothetical protein